MDNKELECIFRLIDIHTETVDNGYYEDYKQINEEGIKDLKEDIRLFLETKRKKEE